MAFKFTNLSALHNNMIIDNETRAKFSFTYNKRSFSCVFICDTVPYILIIAYLGHNFAVELPIDKDYSTPSYLDNNLYKQLIELLGIKFDPNNKFMPTTFFDIINNNIPEKYEKSNYYDVLFTERIIRDIEQADKIYFLGFRNNPSNQSVSPKNYEKTSLAFGTKIANSLKRHNLSTRWTPKKSEENLKELNDFLDRIDC